MAKVVQLLALTIILALYRTPTALANAPSPAPNAKAVLIFELNGTRLYVPRSWVWQDAHPTNRFLDWYEEDQPVRRDDAPGTIYRSRRAFTLYPQRFSESERFSRLFRNYSVHRLEIGPAPRDLASLPRQTLDDIPEVLRRALRAVDEHRFRRAGQGNDHFGVREGDVAASGQRLAFACSSPFDPTSSWCDVRRVAMDGVAVHYVWQGFRLAQSEWRAMDREVQDVLNWLATPPEARSTDIRS